MKYYFGFVAIIILLFIGVKLIFSGGKKTPTNSTTSTSVVAKPTKLADFASTDAEVSVTIIGPITADELHHSVRITVTRDERTVDVMKGYDNLVIKSKSYDNTQAAYDAFLRALSSYGFMSEQKSKIEDDRDACPSGNHYYYDLNNTGSDDKDKHLWSVACGLNFGTAATVGGPTIRSLFKQQILDYDVFTQDIGL